ncbi:MAG: hypothetical protein QOD86_2218 [Miltoncostaeaceae bacterium]|jgi:hypothetical protein|nr:hypothetical protein [Miltoncostaeaceae bacterium]
MARRSGKSWWYAVVFIALLGLARLVWELGWGEFTQSDILTLAVWLFLLGAAIYRVRQSGSGERP